MQRSLSFENLGGLQSEPAQARPKNLWDEEFLDFQPDMSVSSLSTQQKIVTFSAFPFENTNGLKFEKRLGADLGAFVFNKNLENCYLSASSNECKFVSFLNLYEIHPLKLINKKTGNLKEFYFTQYFEELESHFKVLRASAALLNVLIVGNLGGLEAQMGRYLSSYKGLDASKSLVLLFSPLQRTRFVDEFRQTFGCKFVWVGLDRKFYRESVAKSGLKDEMVMRDIEEGVGSELKTLDGIRRQVEGGQVENVFIVWDCEVFASDIFPGKP